MPTGRVLTSTLKCLALLEVVAESPGPIGVSELARMTNAGRGTVHQQLSTLVEAGWVERIEGGSYRLTLRATRIGHHALEQANLGERIRPGLEALAESTGEAVSVAVLDGTEALIVQRVESGKVLRAGLGVGTHMPLATSATGRVLVAFSSPGSIEVLRRQGANLPAEDVLAKVREDGFAIAVDEYMEEISAVSAPLFDQSGSIVAALSLASPTTRFARDASLASVLAAAADVNAVLRGDARRSVPRTEGRRIPTIKHPLST